MKTLKSLSIELFPDQTGASLSCVSVNYQIGSTDDPSLVRGYDDYLARTAEYSLQ